MLKNAEWIWDNNLNNDDEYVDFSAAFNLTDTKNANLNISVDGMFVAYVNGCIAGFGECSDDEDNKLYDTFPLDEIAKKGSNELVISVWHHGVNCSIYKPAKAGCIFSVTQKDKIVLFSNENVLSRVNDCYFNGYVKYITPQLGVSFKYDNRKQPQNIFTKSVIVQKSKDIALRDIENLTLGDRVDYELIEKDNVYTIDMKKETVGFLELEFDSVGDQELLICYGEHLNEQGNVTQIMGIRDFSVEFIARNGQNKYMNPFRRLAGRYIQIYAKKPLMVKYAALRPVNYPVNVVQKTFANPLHDKIYQTSINTLKCCMHAHYEDCPWREQALYALDSRNQMLCGYVAFKEYRFARHNILLLSRALVKDLNILNLTYPKGGRALCIPFFSLVYVMQVAEYVQNSGDRSILDQVKDVVDKIIFEFESRIDELGLLPSFPYPCWNFYEWTDGNNNEIEIGRVETDPYYKHYDLIINAMYVYVRRIYDKLLDKHTDLSKMVSLIKKTFYNSERGLFINSTRNGNYSVVANVFALLCGAADAKLAEKIILEREQLVDISLSMNGFFYEALLSVDQKFSDYIIKDIENKYGYMLEKGATTFWETIVGAADFDGAGSLCHGWSALPIYWLDKLVK